jgi:hypothetical protein
MPAISEHPPAASSAPARPHRSWWRVFSSVCLLAAVCITGLLWIDRTAAEHAAARASSAAATRSTESLVGPAHPGYSRVFVIILDSLRLQTALDPTLMPHLAALRANGVHARMNTVYEGFTHPAVRAAFSGQTQTSIASVIANFHHTDLRIESIFTQLASLGLTSVDYSEGHFAQFGPSVYGAFGPALPGEDRAALDHRLLNSALEHFLDGQNPIVVAHVQITDEIAHEVGIHHRRYREVYQRADEWVRDAASRLPPDATLVVFGDHGHDERGAHKTGLDIPSYVYLRGPGFVPGHDLGTVEIADLRYFLSWALKLPIDQTRHNFLHFRQALIEPDNFAPFRLASAATPVADPSPGKNPRTFWWLALALLGAFALWPFSPWTPPARAALPLWLPWLVLAPVLLGPPFDVPGVLVLGGVALVALFSHRSSRAVALFIAATLAALAALHGWGRVVAGLKLLPPPAPWAITVAWLVIWTAGACVLTAANRLRLTWVATSAAALLAYPALQTLGLPNQALIGPVMATWLLGWCMVGAKATLASAAHPGTRLGTRDFAVLAAALAVFAYFFNQYSSSSAGLRVFRVPVGLETIVPLAVLAIAAKAFCFVAGWRHERPRAITTLVVLLLLGLQWKILTNLVREPVRPWIYVAALAALFALWVWARRRRREDTAWVAGLGLLFTAYYLCIQSQTYHYLWFDLLAAGFVAAARFLRGGRAAPPDRPCGDHALLLLATLLTAYAVSTAWLEGGVEWRMIYWWFPASVVEKNVVFFVPFIAGKMILPYFALRHLLRRELGPVSAATRGLAVFAFGALLTGFLLYGTGLAAVSPLAETFMPHAETAAAFLVLFVFLALT